MEEHARAAQPFFMRVDVWGPHPPYHSAGEFIDRVDPASLEPYPGFGRSFDDMPGNFAWSTGRWDKGERTRSWSWWQTGLARCFEQVMVVDHALGRVVAALDALDLAEDTLVIYTADHGDLIAAHGGKMNKDTLMLEETMRVPMVLRWPGRFGGGRVSGALVSNMDLVATTLDAAGCASPDVADGETMLPLCVNPQDPGRDALMCEDHGEAAVEFFQRMVRWKHYKYVAHLDDLDELYDLAEDPYEHRNLVNATEYAPVLAEVRDVTRSLMDRHEDDSDDAQRLKQQVRLRST
ncbi:MAG TPA: sulfatase/phosphatase domain-containing protein [Planctomycetota bacterium]|nr:sulfatase/phosphatase domain-containing protein [Planctomycetota bacterium]